MKTTNYFKQFLAAAIPSAIVYLALFLFSYIYPAIGRIDLLWWMVLIFGLANVVYFWFVNRDLVWIKDWNIRMHVAGAVMGLFFAIVFIITSGFTGLDAYVRLITITFIGALFWRYCVYYFNRILKIKE